MDVVLSSDAAFFWPMFAMVVLTAIVWVRMYLVRVAEMKEKRIAPQKVSLSGQAAALLENTNAADNFRNLFEVPVLFYAICLMLMMSGSESLLLLGMAWLFVTLRAIHSLIHLTHNTVLQRFKVYIGGTVVLYAMWVVAAVEFAAQSN